MAARLSADRPSLNAATRSGRAAGLRWAGLARGGKIAGMIGLFAEFKRALIKLAPRHAGHFGDLAYGILERYARHRRAQQCVGLAGARLRRRPRRSDYQNDFAARLAVWRILRQRRQIAAPDFFVQLGELAADRSLAGPKPGVEIGERSGETRPGLKQDQCRGNAGEFGDAGAPR